MSDPTPPDSVLQEQSSPPGDDTHDFYPEIADELPARPRTRLLTPLTVALLLALFAACGFVGGVLVEKHQTQATTLVGAATTGRAGAGATGATGAAGGRFASLFAGGGSRGTIGTVTNVDGNKLYVTTATGSMVEVVVTSSSRVTKSESVKSEAVHPGDSVVVTGIAASNGTVTASSVSDSGSSGGAGGGLASLFGGTSGGTTSNSRGVASLFGG